MANYLYRASANVQGNSTVRSVTSVPLIVNAVIKPAALAVPAETAKEWSEDLSVRPRHYTNGR